MPEASPAPPSDLNGWLKYLEQLHPSVIALGLERVRQVRDRSGLSPGFPLITVAGTNGKGSTCAMLERLYLEAGYRVGCYTSPHLLCYNERVRVGGQQVSDAALCAAFAAVEQARDITPLTYFEFGTLAAMWHFIEAGVEVAILEVGLGGRLDAVNIFQPSCTVITSIDLDHIEYLGNSRESIGREKAGIFRQGIATVCGDSQPPVTVTDYAREIGADFRQIGRDFNYSCKAESWDFASPRQRLTGLPLPSLTGSFQLSNAACALEAAISLQRQLPLTEAALRAGLRRVELAGRFQICPGKPPLILDVAHNPHAARGLAENLRHPRPAGRTLAVFAMLGDKDIAGVVTALAGEVDAWFVAGISQPRGASAATLASCLSNTVPGAQVQCCADVTTAFRQACLIAGENDRISAFGSFYTVADVMRAHLEIRKQMHGKRSVQ